MLETSSTSGIWTYNTFDFNNFGNNHKLEKEIKGELSVRFLL